MIDISSIFWNELQYVLRVLPVQKKWHFQRELVRSSQVVVERCCKVAGGLGRGETWELGLGGTCVRSCELHGGPGEVELPEVELGQADLEETRR